MDAAVKPGDFADLIRRATELQHDLRLMRLRVEGAPGPLAVIAAEALAGCETRFETAAEGLKAAASVATLVTLD